MAGASILYVGRDVCQRIPVMKAAGFAVVQAHNSLRAVRLALKTNQSFAAITFQEDLSSLPDMVVQESLNLSLAPLVLFQNPSSWCDGDNFDLVIPALTPPAIWLRKLSEVIEASRKICADSRWLREECTDLRSRSRELRAAAARILVSPIEVDLIWRGNAQVNQKPETSPNEKK